MAIVYRPQKTQEIFLSSPADICVYGGAAGGGKACCLNTTIPSPTGLKTLESISDGDVVFDEHGRQCRVVKAHDAFVPDECYRVAFDDGSTIDCCSDHLWFTYTASDLEKSRRRDPDWMERRRMSRPSRAKFSQGAFKSNLVIERNKKTAEQNRELLSRDPIGSVKTTREIADTLTLKSGRKNHAIPVCGAWEMPEADLPLDPYLLGVWLGDGTTRSGRITTSDCEIVDAFVREGFEVKYRSKYDWGVNGLTGILRSLGVFGNKHVPELYMRASAAQRLALLQGLFDTDGTAKPNTARAIFYSKLEHLADSAFDLAVSLGMKPTLTTKRAKFDGRDYGICHMVAVSSDLPLFRLSRKLDRIAPARSVSRFRYIVSCERIQSVPMRCLTVDSPSRLYLIGRTAIPTHNTFALLFEMARHYRNPNWGGVIFRHEAKQILNEGGLRDSAMELYPGLGAEYRSQPMPTFTFPSGARVSFSHINLDTEVAGWMGSQIPTLCFDELTHFSNFVFFYMLSRCRSTCGVKPYVRATCLSGDTIAVCSDGELIRMDRCSQSVSMLSVDLETGETFGERPSNVFCRKVEDGLRIVTRSSEIFCSKDHRFFKWTPSGIRETVSDHLEVGDYIASARSFPHGSKSVNHDEAYLLGYTIGDGGITGRKHIPRLLWTESDEDHARYIAEIAGHVFSCNVGVHAIKGARAFSSYTTCKSVAVERFIENCPEAVCAQHLREIPSSYTDLDREGIICLLQGLFDSEGHVGKDRIEFCTSSRVLVQQICILLRRFSIFSKFSSFDPKTQTRKRSYHLHIAGVHAVSFSKEIGFRIKRKQMAAERISPSKRGICCSDADLVPIDRERISHLRSFFGNSWWNRNTSIRRETAERVMREAEDAGVSAFPLSEWTKYAWEKLNRKEPSGPFDAYDITMPTEHTFFSGCVVSHNCNPDPDSWVADFIAWWIDQETGYPIKERGGVIRHFVRRPTSSGMEIVWGDTKDDVAKAMGFGRPKDSEIVLANEQLDAALLRGEDIPDEIASGPVQYVKAVRQTRSMSFVPSSVYDNAALLSKDPGYLANLKSLDRVEQARLLGGNWKVRAAAGLYFPVAHVQIVQKLSQNVMQWLRMWDLAATEPNEAHDPDWTVGLKLGRTWTGTVIVGDVIRVRKNARFVRDLVKATALADGRSCWIGLIQDPGQSGKAQFESYREMLRGYSVFSCGSGKKKELIAEPVAAEWQGNNVALVMGDWNRAFIDELEKFPTKGVHDDQVDAFSNGYSLLPPVGQPNYAEAGGLRRRSRER